MCGLALGALIANRPANFGFGSLARSGAGKADEPSASPSPALKGILSPSEGEREGVRGRTSIPCPAPIQTVGSGVVSLSLLALAIAGYALLLPVILPLLIRMGGSAASLALVKAIIALLTLVLAALVGMQFPLANRLEFDGTAAGASRLYTADFVGAFLGAVLACTLLIPLIGVAGVCLLTAGLNLVGALAGRSRKAAA